MKYILYLALAVPTLAQAQLVKMKPGKWLMTITLYQNGKEHDPMAQMKEAMAKMPPEQRKELEASLKTQMGQISDKGTEVCYSKKSFEQVAITKPRPDCEAKTIEDSATKFKSSFTCKDGSKGDSDFTISGDSSVEGITNVTDAKGQKTSVKNKMTFISSDCGGLQPIEIK